MAKYATTEDRIQCAVCDTKFRPDEGFFKQYNDDYMRCPRCRIVITVYGEERLYGEERFAPVLINPECEEEYREQVNREIIADRLLEF